MKRPIANVYEVENARVLVACAADAYELAPDPSLGAVWLKVHTASDTKVVIYRPTAEDVVVAFRGTQSLRNFVTDIEARRVGLVVPGLRGIEVHQGFLLALAGIQDELRSTLSEIISGRPAPRLWITGHSLGAALAKLFAVQSKLALAGVYTFGEPRVGNAAFRNYYDALLKSCTFRMVDGEDFITRMPWLLGAYCHSGTEIFYDSIGVPHVEPGWWLKGASDIFGCWSEWHGAGRLALLADHQVARYVALLRGGGTETTQGTQRTLAQLAS